jgi:hypothetical protein
MAFYNANVISEFSFPTCFTTEEADSFYTTQVTYPTFHLDQLQAPERPPIYVISYMSTSLANFMQQSSLLKPTVTQHDEKFPIL